jgi:hypothetical protein
LDEVGRDLFCRIPTYASVLGGICGELYAVMDSIGDIAVQGEDPQQGTILEEMNLNSIHDVTAIRACYVNIEAPGLGRV